VVETGCSARTSVIARRYFIDNKEKMVPDR